MIESAHADSVVYLLFPIPPIAAGIEANLQWDFLEDVFSAGELGSPLNRLIREDSQLAYSPEFISTTYADGGYAGLVAQTSVQPELVLKAFWQLIGSHEIRSTDWLDYVRDTIRGGIEMHDPDACEYTDEGSASLIHYGRCLSDREYSAKMLSYTDAGVTEWLEGLVPCQPPRGQLCFEGRGVRRNGRTSANDRKERGLSKPKFRQPIVSQTHSGAEERLLFALLTFAFLAFFAFTFFAFAFFSGHDTSPKRVCRKLLPTDLGRVSENISLTYPSSSPVEFSGSGSFG